MKNILIVVDMQNDFVSGSLGSEDAKRIVPNVVRKIKDFDGEIIVTMDTHHEDYLSTKEGTFLPVPHCIEGTDGWEICSEVKEALSSRKTNMPLYLSKNTFGCSNLPHCLNQIIDGEDANIEFIGLCTDICVVSNVLLTKAFMPEANISVDASCCAGVTPEKHNAALNTMKSCHIVIKNEE